MKDIMVNLPLIIDALDRAKLSTKVLIVIIFILIFKK